MWIRANCGSLVVYSMWCAASYHVVQHALGCCESAHLWLIQIWRDIWLIHMSRDLFIYHVTHPWHESFICDMSHSCACACLTKRGEATVRACECARGTCFECISKPRLCFFCLSSTCVHFHYFFGCFASTQLARRLHQERTQVVCSNKVARKRLARRHSHWFLVCYARNLFYLLIYF